MQDNDYGLFDFSTNLFGRSVCMRFGEIGISFVADGGLQLEAGSLGPFALDGKTIHPIQFGEIAARVHYKASLCDASHIYLHSETSDAFFSEQIEVVDYSGVMLADGSQRIFRDWSDKELAKAMQKYGVVAFERLLDEDGNASFTRLVDESGSLLNLAAKEP
jgi:hypothetical protein